MSLDEVYCDMTDLVQNRTVSPDLCPEHGAPSVSDKTSTVETTSDSPDHPSIAAAYADGAHIQDRRNLEHSTSNRSEAEDKVLKPGSCWCLRERVVWNIVEELRRDIEQTTQLTGIC